MSNTNQGKISQIIGPVVDVIFEESQNNLPKIYDALEVVSRLNYFHRLFCIDEISILLKFFKLVVYVI